MLPTIALRGKEKEPHLPWSRKGWKPRLQADCDGSKMDSIQCGTQAPNSCLPTNPICSWKHAEEKPPSEEGEMMVRLRLLTLGKGQMLALHAGWGTVVAVACGFFQKAPRLPARASHPWECRFPWSHGRRCLLWAKERNLANLKNLEAGDKGQVVISYVISLLALLQPPTNPWRKICYWYLFLLHHHSSSHALSLCKAS